MPMKPKTKTQILRNKKVAKGYAIKRMANKKNKK
jgi:hypothetical protein